MKETQILRGLAKAKAAYKANKFASGYVPPQLANSEGFQNLERAGLTEKLPTIRIPQPQPAAPVVQPGAAAAQRTAGMARSAQMGGRALGLGAAMMGYSPDIESGMFPANQPRPDPLPAFNNPAQPSPVSMARGGMVHGAGTHTSDSVPAMLSQGEAVLPAKTVAAAGGSKSIQRLIEQTTHHEPKRTLRGGMHAAVGAVDDRPDFRPISLAQNGMQTAPVAAPVASPAPAPNFTPAPGAGSTGTSGGYTPPVPTNPEGDLIGLAAANNAVANKQARVAPPEPPARPPSRVAAAVQRTGGLVDKVKDAVLGTRVAPVTPPVVHAATGAANGLELAPKDGAVSDAASRTAEVAPGKTSPSFMQRAVANMPGADVGEGALKAGARTLGSAVRLTGRVAAPVAAAMSLNKVGGVALDPSKTMGEKVGAAAEEGLGRWAPAAALGGVGAELGLAGGPVGSAIGGLAGGALGYFAGDKALQWAHEHGIMEDPTKGSKTLTEATGINDAVAKMYNGDKTAAPPPPPPPGAAVAKAPAAAAADNDAAIQQAKQQTLQDLLHQLSQVHRDPNVDAFGYGRVNNGPDTPMTGYGDGSGNSNYMHPSQLDTFSKTRDPNRKGGLFDGMTGIGSALAEAAQTKYNKNQNTLRRGQDMNYATTLMQREMAQKSYLRDLYNDQATRNQGVIDTMSAIGADGKPMTDTKGNPIKSPARAADLNRSLIAALGNAKHPMTGQPLRIGDLDTSALNQFFDAGARKDFFDTMNEGKLRTMLRAVGADEPAFKSANPFAPGYTVTGTAPGMLGQQQLRTAANAPGKTSGIWAPNLTGGSWGAPFNWDQMVAAQNGQRVWNQDQQ